MENKFFKPGCFYHLNLLPDIERKVRDCANAMLERHGTIVYGWGTTEWHESNKRSQHTHQALLINIETLEKCTHPISKVSIEPKWIYSGEPKIAWFCECGAKVKPKEFEEMK